MATLTFDKMTPLPLLNYPKLRKFELGKSVRVRLWLKDNSSSPFFVVAKAVGREDLQDRRSFKRLRGTTDYYVAAGGDGGSTGDGGDVIESLATCAPRTRTYTRHARAHTHAHTHTLTRTHAHHSTTHTLTHPHTHTHMLFAHTHTPTHPHTKTLTHSPRRLHTHTHTNTHSHTLRIHSSCPIHSSSPFPNVHVWSADQCGYLCGASLNAGDKRATVAEQAFGKPFAKVTVAKCGVYEDAPPPMEALSVEQEVDPQ